MRHCHIQKGNIEKVQVSDKLLKPLTEVKYLNADNVSRYRCIMRIFYENNEKLNYWLYQEDVYEEMKKDSYWSEYTIEQCQQDLASLVEWKNLNTMQDTKKVASIEEFKNKKYRYQISEYSVQIERLVLRLENLLVEGASLEPTLLERIRRNVEKFSKMVEEEQADVNAWWNDLNSDFVRLNQNYQDYIRDLNSVKAEEMMHTKEFMVFKDRLIEYLRSFIKGLQRNVGVIEEYLRLLDEKAKKQVFEKVTAYQFAIPRIDIELSKKQIEENVIGRFESIYNWFVATDGHENEAAKLFDATNEIIRRITRYAKKIGVSPYMLFISAFYILLYKYTGQEEITLGSPMANRNRNEMKRMIGMFVNNIVTKANIQPEKTFKEFLNEESANGVVEVILILVVLIGAVVIFRTQLQKLVTDLMTTVTSKAKAIE